jgi:hypothetical protein
MGEQSAVPVEAALEMFLLLRLPIGMVTSAISG